MFCVVSLVMESFVLLVEFDGECLHPFYLCNPRIGNEGEKAGETPSGKAHRQGAPLLSTIKTTVPSDLASTLAANFTTF
jgi:hypothetical protein